VCRREGVLFMAQKCTWIVQKVFICVQVNEILLCLFITAQNSPLAGHCIAPHDMTHTMYLRSGHIFIL
jgi:hypothetical protein